MGRATLFELRPSNDKEIVLSENQVERQITDFLRWQGWYPVRNHVGTFVPFAKAMKAVEQQKRPEGVIEINEAGCADWLFIHANFPPLWVEVKRTGKTPTEKQLHFLEERRMMKQFAVWTDRYEDFKAWYHEHVVPMAQPTIPGQGHSLKALPTVTVEVTPPPNSGRRSRLLLGSPGKSHKGIR